VRILQLRTSFPGFVFAFVAGLCSLAQTKPPVLIPGLGQHHHTISTKNPEAQRFFDQGLTLVYAFNHVEAARSFQRASELDPHAAIAFWGVALALGPCINNPDIDPPHERAAYEAVQKALSLAPEATETERAYIQAGRPVKYRSCGAGASVELASVLERAPSPVQAEQRSGATLRCLQSPRLCLPCCFANSALNSSKFRPAAVVLAHNPEL